MALAEKEFYRKKRHTRIRARLHGTAQRPRLIVFRSNRALYAQLVNDDKGVVIAAAAEVKSKKNGASQAGKALAELAKKAQIETCIFDRNGYKFHGRVKALAEGAREGGLKF